MLCRSLRCAAGLRGGSRLALPVVAAGPRAPALRSLSQSRSDIKFYLVSFTDLFGVQRSKLVPASAIAGTIEDGAGFSGFAAHFDLVPADPDLIAMPDMDSCIQLPWKPEVGWIAADLFLGGEPLAQSPRGALKRQMARAAECGWIMKTGVEIEFMLIDPEPSSAAIADRLDANPKACYDQQALMRRYDLISELSTYMEALGWGPYQADHEDAQGQFEINWDYDDALVTADRHAFFKFMLRSVAENHGLKATMMPKPFEDLTGNGCHMHITMHDMAGGKNVFSDKASGDEYGLSTMAQHFTAGIIDHAGAVTAVACPTVNSYKRLGTASQSVSGATWAPSMASHGGNDRTHTIRVPDAPRLELRVGDMAANPYLYPATVLAAGLDGVEQSTPLIPRAKCPAPDLPAGAAPELPGSLIDAIRQLEADSKLRSDMDGDVVDAFCKLRRQQWGQYSRHLTQWELDNYLDV